MGVKEIVIVGLGIGGDVNDGGVGLGEADAEAAAEEEGDGDGFAEAVEGDGEGAAGGAPVTAAALVAGVRLGDGPLAGSVLAVPEAPAGLLDRAASAWRGVGETPSASTVMIPVAAIAITIAATAAMPDNAGLRGLTGSGKPFGRNGPAWYVTSRRYSRVSGLESLHSLSTSSPSPCGRVASEAMPYSTAGCSAPCLRSAQTSHWSM